MTHAHLYIRTRKLLTRITVNMKYYLKIVLTYTCALLAYENITRKAITDYSLLAGSIISIRFLQAFTSKYVLFSSSIAYFNVTLLLNTILHHS